MDLSEEEELILKVIGYSSKFDVMDLLDEWFHNIKFIFDRLLSDDDLKVQPLAGKVFHFESDTLGLAEYQVEL